MRVVWLTALLGLAFSLGLSAGADSISISAPAFGVGKPMPAKFAYKGRNLSPELRIGNVPANAKSLVLIVDDPDSPSGLWTHWLVWNIPAATSGIAEGASPTGAVQGQNSFGHDRYDGPSPPNGTHRYYFHLYALDTTLTLPEGSSREALASAMKNHFIGKGETFGTYAASQ